MPIPAAAYFALEGGFFDLPYIFPILKTIPFLFLFYVLKVYFGGARNTSERDMHSKVVMITVHLPLLSPPLSRDPNLTLLPVQGGTSGVGAAVARDASSRATAARS